MKCLTLIITLALIGCEHGKLSGVIINPESEVICTPVKNPDGHICCIEDNCNFVPLVPPKCRFDPDPNCGKE